MARIATYFENSDNYVINNEDLSMKMVLEKTFENCLDKI